MTPGHETHAVVEAGAAIALSVGGAVVLARTWLDRRSTAWPGIRPPARRRSPGAAVRRAGRLVAAVLSAGAAAIHLAAGPEHVEALGDTGLLFYWAALFQAGLVVALLTGRVSPAVIRVGIAGNAALVVAWAWSRTAGIPIVPGGPEPAGIADSVAVVLEIAVVALLVAWTERLDLWITGLAAPREVRTAATSGLVAVIGTVVLATTVAVVDTGAGHHATGTDLHAASVHAP